MRRGALLTVIAFILNIVVPFATVVADAQSPAAERAALWTGAQICSADRTQEAPAPTGRQSHGPACPLCLLLGSQALAPHLASPALPSPPLAFGTCPPPREISAPSFGDARRPTARAPPVLV